MLTENNFKCFLEDNLKHFSKKKKKVKKSLCDPFAVEISPERQKQKGKDPYTGMWQEPCSMVAVKVCHVAQFQFNCSKPGT